MIKNIIIGILGLICLFLLVFGRIQTAEAEKHKILAEENLRLAKENVMAAEKAEEAATRAAAEAIREKRAADIAREELAECKNK